MMAIKSLGNALRHGGSSVRLAQRCIASQPRCFSSSPANRRHGVPALSDSASTPELTALLSTIRKTIFLPTALSKQHRDLVYSSKNARMLQDDPVKVEINGEEFRLQHIDRTKDVPNATRSLDRAMSLFNDKKDWDNLPNLLEGFHGAGIKLKSQSVEKMIRKAGKAGRSDVIVECLRRSSKTKFTLDDPKYFSDLMFWIQQEAAGSRSKDKAKKALRMAQEVLRLAEQHDTMASLSESTANHVIVTGVLLELVALEAKLDGSVASEKLKAYAERLLDMTAKDPDLEISMPLKSGKVERNHWLAAVVPVVKAWVTAADVLSPNEAYLSRAKALKDRVNSVYNAMVQDGEENLLGAQTYKLLLQSEAQS